MNLGLALRTDRLGENSWQRLRSLRHVPEEEEEEEEDYCRYSLIKRVF